MNIIKKIILTGTTLWAISCSMVYAGKLPKDLTVEKSGDFHIGDISFQIKWYLPGWKCYSQSQKSVKEETVHSDNTVKLDGIFNVRGNKVNIQETISADEDNSFHYSAILKPEKSIKTQQLVLVAHLSSAYSGKTFYLDAKKYTFPDMKSKRMIVQGKKIKLFSIRVNQTELIIKGDVKISLEKVGGKSFALKIFFSPGEGNISTSELSLEMEIKKGNGKILEQKYGSFKITAGKDWQPITGVTPLVKKGSALDFSFMQDGPAGKYGHVIFRNGHFELEKKPGKKFRLYGVNLCFSAQYLNKDECEKLVETLSRIGYNSVRIHHYDNMLIKKNARSSTDFDFEALDKLDYLFYCCKKAGIYLTIDFYCNRTTRKGEFDGVKAGLRFKSMLPIDERFLASWKVFVRKLLTHKNPYTKMTWAEDPTLAIASMVNEDTIYTHWKGNKQAYEKAFKEWTEKNKLKYTGEREKVQGMARFLTELQVLMYKKMKYFINKELNSKVLLTGVNYKNAEAQSFIREKLDYVDNHSYFNHPHFYPKKAWRFPVKFSNNSPVASFAASIRDAGLSRIYGKPYTVTESNYVYPNGFRGQGGAVMGAFAASQDWDAVYRFAYSHNREYLFNKTTMRYFDIVADPVNLLAERIISSLFLRKDVEAAPERFVYIYDDSAYKSFKDFSKEAGRFTYTFAYFALLGQIGCINRDRLSELKGKNVELFNSCNSKNSEYPIWKSTDSRYKKIRTGGQTINSNGQIDITPSKKLLKVVTPRSEAYCISDNAILAGNFMKVENKKGFATLFITSLSGKTLVDAKRLLMLQLPDVQNSNIKFITRKRKELLSWGTLPLLQSHSIVDVTLNISGNIEVWALGFDGNRLFKIPASNNAGKISMQLDNFKLKNTMAYEIIKL